MGTDLDQIYQNRLAALSQAAHDIRGVDSAEFVVARAAVYLTFLENGNDIPVTERGLSDEQIAHMVSRFLWWKLPENFRPDCGITFEAEHSKEFMAAQGKPPMRHEPVGTNLLGADQAKDMVRFMVEGLPAE